jgi:cell division protease FtsH
MSTTMPADRWTRRHLSGTARPGPPPDRPPSPAPPPPPAWRNWLLILGLLVTVALFLLPVPTTGKVEQLSYSQLKMTARQLACSSATAAAMCDRWVSAWG